MIYQHFWGICDGFLRNYLTIIRLLKIFVDIQTYSITFEHLCLHLLFLCLVEYFVYIVRVFSQNIRVSCETAGPSSRRFPSVPTPVVSLPGIALRQDRQTMRLYELINCLTRAKSCDFHREYKLDHSLSSEFDFALDFCKFGNFSIHYCILIDYRVKKHF